MTPRPFTRYVTGSTPASASTGVLVLRAAAGAAAAATAGGRGHGQRRGELGTAADRGEAGHLHAGSGGLARRADGGAVAIGERGQLLEPALAGLAAILVDGHRDAF